VANRLAELGAQLSAIDPKVTAADVPAGVELVECTPEVLAASDVVVILTDHDDVDWELVERHADRVLDTRNRIRAAGVDLL
jgi:UDP-N-acetyl-D-mannosaminuronic acid dehydrogenase/UDP-N-acetyl-D-glucosamine dehydrogenase